MYISQTLCISKRFRLRPGEFRTKASILPLQFYPSLQVPNKRSCIENDLPTHHHSCLLYFPTHFTPTFSKSIIKSLLNTFFLWGEERRIQAQFAMQVLMGSYHLHVEYKEVSPFESQKTRILISPTLFFFSLSRGRLLRGDTFIFVIYFFRLSEGGSFFHFY